MESPPPLLVFQSFVSCSRLCRELGLIEGNTPRTLVDECFVDHYHRQDAPNSLVNVTVLRVPGGLAGFKQRMCSLSRHFSGHIFVFHPDLPPQSTLPGTHNPRLVINPRPEVYASVLRVTLGDRQRHQLTAASPVVRLRLGSAVATVRAPTTTVHEDDLDDIFRQPSPPPPPPLQYERESSDEDLQQAIRESLEEEARVAAAESTKIIPLEEAWKRVLKAPEPVAPGQPACILCIDNRASICFVDCGHQVACDACVEILRTRAGVCKQCVICRSEVTGIVRPIVVAEAEPPLKRQCTKKK